MSSCVLQNCEDEKDQDGGEEVFHDGFQAESAELQWDRNELTQINVANVTARIE